MKIKLYLFLFSVLLSVSAVAQSIIYKDCYEGTSAGGYPNGATLTYSSTTKDYTSTNVKDPITATSYHYRLYYSVDRWYLDYIPANGSQNFYYNVTTNSTTPPISSPTAPNGWIETNAGCGTAKKPATNLTLGSGATVVTPTVTTTAVTIYASTTATLGGNVTVDGGATVKGRGVVYGTSANPVIGGSGVTQIADASGGTGTFSASATGLISATTYHVRAYAINSAGTSYGSDVTFTTQSVDATLSNLAIGATTISPTFTSGTTSYTAMVSNSVDYVTITPTATNANATIKVNGSTTKSGYSSSYMPVAVGSNSIPVVVTAQDGSTTKTYTLTVIRAGSSVATLNALSISSGTLSPTFSSGTQSYAASVVNATTSITLTPTTTNANATVSVNGTTVASGTASGAIPLAVGANTIQVTTIAQDNVTSQTYTVTVTRAGSSVATLSNLSINPGTLSPIFASSTTNYTAGVNNSVNSVTVTPTTTDANATVSVNGIAVTSGTASSAIPLAVGANTIQAVTTAQDGSTTQTYNLTVTRASASAITTSVTTLPGFNSCYGNASAAQSFTVKGSNLTSDVTVTSPAGFEVAQTSGGPYQTSLTLTQSNGAISTTLYVRMAAVASSPAPGNIMLSATSATTQNVAVSGAQNARPTINLSSVTRVTSASTSFSLPYTATTGSPDLYSIFTGKSNPMSGFMTINNAKLTSSPITIAMPAGTVEGKYDFYLTATNSSTGCISYSNSFIVTVTSSDATLASLTTSQGTLSPTFASGTTSYTTSVDNSVSSITLKPSTTNANATVTINGTTVQSGTASSAIPLAVGANTIQTKVTAQDGSTNQTYNLTVNRAAASVITTSVATLPAFGSCYANASTAQFFTVKGGNLVSDITVTPPAGFEISQTSGGPYQTSLILTQTNGTVSATLYTRMAASASSPSPGNITLSATGATTQNVALSGTQNPRPTIDFGSISSVNRSATSFSVPYTATTGSPDLYSIITGSKAMSGFTAVSNAKLGSSPIVVAMPAGTAAGVYDFYLTVTNSSTDCISYSNYFSIAVVSSDATLSSLNSPQLTLSPAFNAATTSYTSSVSNSTSLIGLIAGLNDGNATMKVNGSTAKSQAANYISLAVGTNTIPIVVTAQDGVTTKTYTLTINRAASSVATLNALSISSGNLSPVFNSNTQSYAASVSNATTSIAIKPTATDATATISVNSTPVISGTASSAIPLAVGSNTIQVVVTAQDGSTQKAYTLTVMRAGSSVATLNALSISSGTLSPTFNSGTQSYAASVVNATTSVTLTPTTTDANATVSVNGTTVTLGTASGAIPLAVGNNTIQVVVTAQDGITQQAYTVNVTRIGSSVATLSNLSISSGTLSPTFASGTTSYNANVENSVSSITLKPNTTDDNAIVTVNGTTVQSGTASGAIPLAVGANTIQVVTTAQDGATSKTYTLNVTRNTATPVITFFALRIQQYGDAPDFALAATSTNTSTPITYTSSNPAVATITPDNKLHTVGAGSAVITASQAADATHAAAASVQQTYIAVPLSVTVTVNPQTKVYGQADPALTYQLTSGKLVGEDTFTGSLTRNAGENVAAYAIHQGTLTLGSNYNLTFKEANLTITPAAITIAANPQAKVYGQADPSLTYQITSGKLVSSQDAFIGSLTRDAGENAGTYAIQQGTLVLNNNYTLSYNSANLIINKAGLIITADNQTKVYGAANPTLTANYLGFVGGDDASIVTTQPVLATTATTTSPVGTYPITVSGAIAANYTPIYHAGTLTITAGQPAITFATLPVKNYGDADFAAGATSTGSTALTYSSDNTAVATVVDGNIHIVGAGTANITAMQVADANNSAAKSVVQTLTVNKAAITLTANAQNKNYGDADPALTYKITSGALIGQDAFTGSLTRNAGENIGTYAIQQGTLGLSSNYNLTYNTANLTITPAAITITANPQTKVYGQADPSLTYNITSGTLVGQDKFTGSLVRDAGENAGTYAIKQGTLALNNNYTLNYRGANLTIDKASLTIVADNQTKVYGAINPTLTTSYQGFVGGDDASIVTTQPVLSTTAITTSPLGTYPISVSGVVIPNYTPIYQAGTLTVTAGQPTITFAALPTKTYGDADFTANATSTGSAALTYSSDNVAVATVTDGNIHIVGAGTANITATQAADANNSAAKSVTQALTVTKAAITLTANAQSKTYGDADPSLTYQVTSGSLIGSDAFSGSLTRSAGENVGSYAIQQGTLALSNNYKLTYTGANLNIGAKAITITADVKAKTYGDTDPALTYKTTLGTLVGSDTFTGSLTRAAGENTGTYAISQGTLAVSTNYVLTYVGAGLTINKAGLTITAENKTKIYGQANPNLTVSYNGFVNGDDASKLTTQPMATTTAVNSSPAGTYAITANGAASTNYVVTYVPGTLTVQAAQPAITLATLPAKTYGDGDFSAGATSTNAVTPITYTSTNTAVATIVSGKVHIISAGTTTITASQATDANHVAAADVSQLLTVSPAAITVTANAQSKTYGTTDPTLTYKITSGTLVGSDAFSGSLTRDAGESVGSYAIKQGSLALNGNYALTYTGANLIIGKAILTIAADNKTKVYGEANPALTVTYNGFINGDNASQLASAATASTIATTASGAGTYDIQVNGAVSNNYTIVYNKGTLTVTPALLTVTANNQTKLYGTANPALTVSYSGFVNGDDASKLSVQPVANTLATTNSIAGTYAITPSSGVSANYSFMYVNGILTVMPTERTLTFNSLSEKTYGDSDFNPGATANTGEVVLYSSSNTSVATIVNGKIHIVGAGVSTITATLAANGNYTNMPSVTHTLIVNKAPQIINFAIIPNQLKGVQYSLSAVTASSGLPVTLVTSDPVIASVNGQTLSANRLGSITITATQEGNANYLPATTVKQTFEVVDASGSEVLVRQAVSPNGDGINDVLYIEGINEHPVNRVTVINRNGVKIFDTQNYNNASNAFDGHSNITGAMQQAGTYFYLLEYTVNGEGRRKTGWFILKY
ncbi:hypothetical protein HH214_04665 [Mucilaginibacter robiniae]|uniref:T9SS type B sorting domain-containing protein n=1 Tax=Mucilaginibacter robiniae TaxID=2728022 RepID=A0A7L5DYT9_9SPHI|nr:MBG domain-containing protein [Mucilaginibacter robiniae]QJD95219.1 hypothetical protein HH214_04665 [Mucilaginibacter robiniae]